MTKSSKIRKCFRHFAPVILTVLPLILGSYSPAAASGSLTLNAEQGSVDLDQAIIFLSQLRQTVFAYLNANLAYVNVVQECSQRYDVRTVHRQTPGLDEVCAAHFRFLFVDLAGEFSKLRQSLALANIKSVRWKDSYGVDFFSDSNVSLILNRAPEHPDFTIAQLIEQGRRAKLQPLEPWELQTVTESLRNSLRSSCSIYAKTSEWESPFRMYGAPLDDRLRTRFCQFYTENPTRESERRLLQTLLPLTKTAWVVARDAFVLHVKNSLIPHLQQDAVVNYSRILNRHPLLLLFQGWSTFRQETPKVFSELRASLEHTQNDFAGKDQSQKVDQLLIRWKHHQITRDEKAALIEALEDYMALDFLTESTLLKFQWQKSSVATAGSLLHEKWMNQQRNKDLAIGALNIASIGLCFLPVSRIVKLPKVFLAGSLSFKNICLFSLGQPMGAVYAFGSVRTFLRTYELFLSNANGDVEFLKYDELSSSEQSMLLSILMLPLGSKQTLEILSKLPYAPQKLLDIVRTD